ncbi:MAG: 2-hydroxychromene-2-carboxylate isomerase [Rhodospirillales bacterium]
MSKTVDYYVTLISPWTYLGSQRFEQIVKKHGATVRIFPVDFGVIFPATGGLPLAKRAPERQKYRLMELERWRKYLGVPLTIHPKFFPANEAQAASATWALKLEQGDAAALKLAHAVLRAVWAEEKNVADPETLKGIIAGAGFDAEALMGKAAAPEIAERRKSESEAAIARGVFGAPSFVYKDEVFWGQDRLEFLDRALAV